MMTLYDRSFLVRYNKLLCTFFVFIVLLCLHVLSQYVQHHQLSIYHKEDELFARLEQVQVDALCDDMG